MITFTARSGAPFVAIERSEEELLAQGAMTVLALDLDRSDVILNPYPLTGPTGLSLGFLPWLISGAALAQHHPFDYGAFAEQLIATGATVTALPAPVLGELAKDGVPQRSQCRLRRVGAVWTGVEPVETLALPFGEMAEFFDLYPLGDLAGIVLKRKAQGDPVLLPLGKIPIGDDGDDAIFVETKLAPDRDSEGYGEILLRGPVVPSAQAEGPLAADGDGFIGTGLLGKRGGGEHDVGHLASGRHQDVLHHQDVQPAQQYPGPHGPGGVVLVADDEGEAGHQRLASRRRPA